MATDSNNKQQNFIIIDKRTLFIFIGLNVFILLLVCGGFVGFILRQTDRKIDKRIEKKLESMFYESLEDYHKVLMEIRSNAINLQFKHIETEKHVMKKISTLESKIESQMAENSFPTGRVHQLEQKLSELISLLIEQNDLHQAQISSLSEFVENQWIVEEQRINNTVDDLKEMRADLNNWTNAYSNKFEDMNKELNRLDLLYLENSQMIEKIEIRFSEFPSTVATYTNLAEAALLDMFKMMNQIEAEVKKELKSLNLTFSNLSNEQAHIKEKFERLSTMSNLNNSSRSSSEDSSQLKMENMIALESYVEVKLAAVQQDINNCNTAIKNILKEVDNLFSEKLKDFKDFSLDEMPQIISSFYHTFTNKEEGDRWNVKGAVNTVKNFIQLGKRMFEPADEKERQYRQKRYDDDF